MTTDQILSDLESMIRQIIEPLDSKVVPSATLKDDLGIDSITQVDLLIQIERSYEVTFAGKDVARFVRVADIIDFLAERLPE